MENKINIAELLKDCPRGMELDCTMYDTCTLEIVFEGCLYPIQIQTPEGLINLTKYGSMSQSTHSKCVIFPKGKTTWEGFVPFVKGDIIYTDGIVAILCSITERGTLWYYCYYFISEDRCKIKTDFGIGNVKDNEVRLATEEEKQKLFDAIKANGYKWNPETKTLEKFIEPIFEVGNKIEKCGYRFTIAEVKDDYYLTKCGNKIPIANQDDFILVLNKFDITTLKAFESRVLVRDTDTDAWKGAFYSHYKSKKIYIIGGSYYYQCIPYEGNEHLLGTSNDCDEFYKNW